MSSTFLIAVEVRVRDCLSWSPRQQRHLTQATISQAYTDEVNRRREYATKRSVAALSDLAKARMVATQLKPGFQLSVREASGLGVTECRTEYIARYRPLVITGLEPVTDPGPWTLKWLADQCGSKKVAVNMDGSQMKAACSVSGVEVMSFDELRERVEARTQPLSYLYDCALPLKVPLLCERVGIPHYFAHDWLQRTRHLHAFSRSWPSLFVGSAGTRSSLHIDQWKGHFWMAQLQGCKRWTIFHPDDVWCLAPAWDDDAARLEPTFPSLDLMEAHPERYPLLALARRVDHLLRPGEVLLVPGGAPHRVVNGASDTDPEPSVAIAGNFVDASNRAAAVADLWLMARRTANAPPDPGALATASALAELDLCEADDAGDADPPARARHAVPWAEYARGSGAEPTAEACYWLEAAGAPPATCAHEPGIDGGGATPLQPGADFVDSRSDSGSECYYNSEGEYESMSDAEQG